MRPRIKFCNLALLAALAAGVLATPAPAETGGHFVTTIDEGWIVLKETETHQPEYSIAGFDGIVCKAGEYFGTISEKTWEAISYTRENTECSTTKSGSPVKIEFNECKIVFLIGKKAAADNTTKITCPTGKEIVISHSECVIKVPAQEGFKGVSYTNIEENGKHVVTLKATVGSEEEEEAEGEIEAYFESGLCILLGTKHQMAITGSLTLSTLKKDLEQVDVTATGSEDE